MGTGVVMGRLVLLALSRPFLVFAHPPSLLCAQQDQEPQLPLLFSFGDAEGSSAAEAAEAVPPEERVAVE